MIRAIKQEITVESPGVLEVHSPELYKGARAEVIIIFLEENSSKPFNLTKIIGKGKGCYASSEEADIFLRNERDKWE